MIVDLLSEFYGHAIPSVRYELLRSFMVEGHEVAWMKYIYTGGENPARNHWAYALKCECDFTEGVGWMIDDKDQRVTIGKPLCPMIRRVRSMRADELRVEYQIKHLGLHGTSDLHEHVGDIALDLLARSQAGEFIHADLLFNWAGVAATLVSSITDVDVQEVFDVMEATRKENTGVVAVDLVGMTYAAAPVPAGWFVHREVDEGGWTVRALLPDDESNNLHAWRFQLIDPDRKLVQAPTDPYILLEHPIDFGVDEEDEERADRHIEMLLRLAQKPKFPAL